MLLPVKKVTPPSCLTGQKNGQLNSTLLVECGIGKFTMVQPAARAMRAMVAAATAAGYRVWATGTYRTYQQQVDLFNSRYTSKALVDRPTKVWNGVKHWQLPRTAMAAVPGTSNHGLGLACDLALKNSKGETVSVTQQFVVWLVKNAATYGYSFEAQSENWHVRYFAGDKMTPAVLAFEGGISPVEQPKPATTSNPTPTDSSDTDTYTVKAGDTYWKISANFLGSGNKWKRISKMNNDKPLHPGDIIKVPKS